MSPVKTTVSPQRLRARCSRVLALTAALLAPQASFAYEFINSTSASAGSNAIGPGDGGNNLYTGTVVTPVTTTGTIDVSNGGGFARQTSISTADATLGAVHAWSSAASSVGAPAGIVNASGLTSAFSEYNDIFVINSASYAAGTVATLTANVLVSGIVGGSGFPNMPYAGNGQAWAGGYYWRSTTRIGNDFWVSDVQGNSASWSPLTLVGDGTFGMLSLTTQVTLGQDTNVVLRAETEANSAASTLGGVFTAAQSSFLSDLARGMSWQGITSLTVGGVSVSDYTALSASSGFNFAKSYDHQIPAVPEPETYSMLIAGLGLLGFAARRRKQKAA